MAVYTDALPESEECALFSERHVVVSTHRQLLGLFYHTLFEPLPSLELSMPALSRLADLANVYGCTYTTNMVIEN